MSINRRLVFEFRYSGDLKNGAKYEKLHAEERHFYIFGCGNAKVAELADAPDLGSGTSV